MKSPIELKRIVFKKGTKWSTVIKKCGYCTKSKNFIEENLCENGKLKDTFDISFFDDDFIEKIIEYINPPSKSGFYIPIIQWIPTNKNGKK